MIIFGKNSVIEALKSSQAVQKVTISDGLNKDFSGLVSVLCKKRNISLKIISRQEFKKIEGNENYQGIIAEVEDFKYCDLTELLNQPTKFLCILDGIEDPHNFGAILRSADAFSVDGVIIKSKNQVPLNWTVAKVSTGAIEYVKVAQVSNLSNAIKTLKDNGFWVYAADGSGKDSYEKLDYKGAVALIVGSEGRGISQLVMKNSDFIIKIPMSGHVNSLNVSVSTGILLSRIRNK